MDEERAMVKLVRILLENGVITFVGSTVGGVVLGPAGLPIGAALSSGLHLLSSDGFSTWERLRGVKEWKELVILTLKVAAQLAITNAHLLYNLAISIYKLLSRILNNDQNLPVSH